MRRAACSALRPHMPKPPSPPALVTAAARAGVLALPIGACRMGHLRLRLSVRVFVGHMRASSSVRLPNSYRRLVRGVGVTSRSYSVRRDTFRPAPVYHSRDGFLTAHRDSRGAIRRIRRMPEQRPVRLAQPHKIPTPCVVSSYACSILQPVGASIGAV